MISFFHSQLKLRFTSFQFERPPTKTYYYSLFWHFIFIYLFNFEIIYTAKFFSIGIDFIFQAFLCLNNLFFWWKTSQTQVTQLQFGLLLHWQVPQARLCFFLVMWVCGYNHHSAIVSFRLSLRQLFPRIVIQIGWTENKKKTIEVRSCVGIKPDPEPESRLKKTNYNSLDFFSEFYFTKMGVLFAALGSLDSHSLFLVVTFTCF